MYMNEYYFYQRQQANEERLIRELEWRRQHMERTEECTAEVHKARAIRASVFLRLFRLKRS
jgi:hypothetical protein